MTQRLLIDFYLKDQAGVDTLTAFMTSYGKDLVVEGYKEVEHYVNQDDPLHLVYMVEWTSRDRYDQAMTKMFANAEIATMLEAVFADQPRNIWLRKTD